MHIRNVADTYSVSLSAFLGFGPWLLCAVCLKNTGTPLRLINMERFQMDIGSFVLFLFSLCITVQWNPKICVFSSSAEKDVNYFLVLYMSVKNVWFILEKKCTRWNPLLFVWCIFCVKTTKRVNIGQSNLPHPWKTEEINQNY